MAHEFFRAIAWLAIAFTSFGTVYLIVAIGGLRAFRSRRPEGDYTPPATIFKPLAGEESRLFENLSSFCEQDYPQFQVIFGVRDAADPAAAVARDVIAAHPDRDVSLVIDARVRGANLKIANVMNMASSAKYGIYIIADSDMNVDPEYLRSVTAPFADPNVGAVTCLYSGEPAGGFVAELGAMFVNDIFVPSVLVSALFQKIAFCLGGTMAVRREVLAEIGGFEALAPHLADDEMLGRLVSKRGYRVVLASYVLRNIISESTLAELWSHELRWSRTILHARPLGYGFFFVTYALPMSVLALLLSLNLTLGAALIGSALALRIILHYSALRALRARAKPTPWLIPLRDAGAFGEWIASFFGRSVRWRAAKMKIGTGGTIETS